jgi:hypothetical protein
MRQKEGFNIFLDNLKHYKWYDCNFVAFYGILMNM